VATAEPPAGGSARLAALAARIGRLTGWRRALVALAAGALATAALPPVHAVPLLLVAFPVLVWLLDGRTRARGAFLDGFLFGLGHWLTGIYWVAEAMLVQADRFAWLIPVAVPGLAAVLAVFPALAVVLAWRLAPPGTGRVLLLVAAWTALAWLRGWIFTGFPWNVLATAWTPWPAMLQPAAWLGAYGLGLATVAAAALPARLAAPGWRNGVAAGAGLLVLAGLGAAGGARLAGADGGVVPGVRLRLVQPAVPQGRKWVPEERPRHVKQLIRMSRRPGSDGRTHVIWPETAVPYFLGRNGRVRRAVARAAPPGGAVVTGAPRAGAGTESGGLRAWNSIRVVRPDGTVSATYDKHHLVPFGEYMPLSGILPLERLAPGRGTFTPGDGPRRLPIPGAPPANPLVCYEAIFPGAVTDAAGKGRWLLNLTNDAWFGTSAGPHQHFAAARLRAVEEGRPLVRVANTGISGVVDSYGRVRALLGLGEKGIIDTPLPRPLSSRTPYAVWGNALPLVLVVVVGVAGLAVGRYRA